MEIPIFIILIGLSALFSSAETAFFSLHESQIKILETKGHNRTSLIKRLKGKPQELLITILIGNNVVNLFTASYATVIAIDYFGSIGLGVATGATTFLLLIFGEIIPKSLAYSFNTKIAAYLAIPIYVFELILYPIIFLLVRFNIFLNRSLGLQQNSVTGEEEVIAMTHIGVEAGSIDSREREMIENVFEFDSQRVKDVMTPWRQVKLVNGTVPVEQIAHFISQEGFSRYPVYDDNNTSNIIGYVHVNKILKILNSDDRDRPVADFIIPVKIIDENMYIDRVFRSMKKDKSHLYLVHAKKDSRKIVGVITMENLLEEIVGDIRDETDEFDDN